MQDEMIKMLKELIGNSKRAKDNDAEEWVVKARNLGKVIELYMKQAEKKDTVMEEKIINDGETVLYKTKPSIKNCVLSKFI